MNKARYVTYYLSAFNTDVFQVTRSHRLSGRGFTRVRWAGQVAHTTSCKPLRDRLPTVWLARACHLPPFAAPQKGHDQITAQHAGRSTSAISLRPVIGPLSSACRGPRRSERCRDCSELVQGGLQVLDDLGGNELWSWQVSGVF